MRTLDRTTPMGRINVTAHLRNSVDISAARDGLIEPGAIRQARVEFLVDTGAALLCLPVKIIEQLGLQRRTEQRVKTANGTVVRGVYSPVEVQLMDRNMEMPVMEVPDETPPLLGYIPLEMLDLYPNPRTQKLEGDPATGGKQVIDLF